MNNRFEENKRHIGSVIQENRKKTNKTQEDIAELLDVNKSTISRYEKGILEVPASSLEVISDHCNFNPIEYFHNKKNPCKTIEKIAENMHWNFNLELLKKNLPTDTKTTEERVPDNIKADLDCLEWFSRKADKNIVEPLFYCIMNDALIEVQRNNSNDTYMRFSRYYEAFKEYYKK